MAKVELKKPIVEEIAQNIDGAAGVVLVNYSGLTVAQDTQLRKELREAGIVYKVYKNTMMNFAFKGTPVKNCASIWKGPTLWPFPRKMPQLPRESWRSSQRPLRSWSWLPVSLKAATMIRLVSKHFPKYLPERNCLENCWEASSPPSQTLPALSARSRSPKRRKSVSDPAAGSRSSIAA